MDEPEQSSETTRIERLTDWERVSAAAIGAACAAIATLLLVSPPKTEKALNLASCETAQECIARVESDATVYVTALIGVASIAALVALLGVRFTRVKFGNTELGGVVTVTDVSSDSKDRSAETSTEEQPDPTKWEELPSWVKSGVIAWAEDNPKRVGDPMESIIDARKPSGRGNYSWNVELLGNDEPVTLRLGKGKGGQRVEESSGTS